MSTALVLISALLLDRLLGEPRKFHPLVGFGHWAKWVEQGLYPNSSDNTLKFKRGLLSWLLVVGVPLAVLMLVITVSFYLFESSLWQFILSVFVVYIAIAARSLREHAVAVVMPLLTGNLSEAREKLGYIVSRDTKELDQTSIATATTETVLENSHDAVVALMFWFVLAGIPGVLLFRIVNTLDAMWGYRNERYLYFGKWAARADDVMGYLSARVTVLLFACTKLNAWKIARRDGSLWYSPNAGPVMAAGAGALGLSLGGEAPYGGEKKQRPVLGNGPVPQVVDIVRAISLTERSYWLFAIIIGLIEGVYFVATSWG